MRYLPLLPLCFVGAACAAPAPIPVEKTFKDWYVACDNTLRCTAVAVHEMEGGANLLLRISRQAPFDAAPVVDAMAWTSAGPRPLLLDGKPLATALAPVNDGQAAGWHGEGETANAFLSALRNGRVLSQPGPDGAASASLEGLTATLLFMDEQQHRLGTRSALIRPGDGASLTAPAPPLLALQPFAAVPALPADEAQRVLDAVRQAAASDLQGDADADEPAAELQAWALNADTALVIARYGCAAYNCDHLVYLVPRAAPAQLQALDLPPFPAAEPITNTDEQNAWTWGAVSYDPATGVLEAFSKARGLGDCGSIGRWRFDGERFQPLFSASMGECVGYPSMFWPVSYRADPAL